MTETRQLADFAAGLEAGPARRAAVRPRPSAASWKPWAAPWGAPDTPWRPGRCRAARRQGDGGRATVRGPGLARRAGPGRVPQRHRRQRPGLRRRHRPPGPLRAHGGGRRPGGGGGRRGLRSRRCWRRSSSATRWWPGWAWPCAPPRSAGALVSGYGPHQGFGAVAAAGRLLDLDPERMVHAFGLCGAFAPVPSTKGCNWDDRPLSWTKDMVAWPSMAASTRPCWPRRGSWGPGPSSKGSKGSSAWPVRTATPRTCWWPAWERSSRILDLYFKPYPCCRWNHAALDGVRRVLARRGWAAADVAEVRVGVAEEVLEDLDDTPPATWWTPSSACPTRWRWCSWAMAPGARLASPELLASPPGPGRSWRKVAPGGGPGHGVARSAARPSSAPRCASPAPGGRPGPGPDRMRLRGRQGTP